LEIVSAPLKTQKGNDVLAMSARWWISLKLLLSATPPQLPVKGKYDVSIHLDVDNPAGNTDEKQIAICVFRGVFERNLGYDNPFLPPLDRIDHVMPDQSFENFIVLLEYQVIQPGTEFRIHNPLTRPGAEYLQNALPDVLVFPCGGGRHIRCFLQSLRSAHNGRCRAFGNRTP
jgi:hypothetical protein